MLLCILLKKENIVVLCNDTTAILRVISLRLFLIHYFICSSQAVSKVITTKLSKEAIDKSQIKEQVTLTSLNNLSSKTFDY
jgi:hypothetical protein